MHPPLICYAAVMGSLLLAAGPLAAAEIPLVNAGFETTTVDGAFPQAAGWSASTLTALHSAFPKPGNDSLGTRFGFASVGGPASQTVPVALAANTTYTFKGYAVENGNGVDLRFEIGYDSGSGFVELAGTTYDLNAGAPSAWTLLSGVSYTTGSTGSELGQDITVRIRSMGLEGQSGQGVWFDDVSLDATALSFQVTILPNATTLGTYDFSWNSRPGMVYDLLSSTDLATPIADWPVYDDGATLHENIPATGETTTLTAVPSSDPRRFFAMREVEGPPLLTADFEENDGGFTTSKTAGSDWEWGTPASTGPGGTVNSGNGGSAKCWGTNIGNPGFYDGSTTDSRLISPVIDLTSVAGAELSFAHAIDVDTAGGDTAVLRIVNADTDEEIVFGVFPLMVTDPILTTAAWESSGPHTLPVGTPVRIVWSLTGTGGANQDFMGWYIDDVSVVETAP